MSLAAALSRSSQAFDRLLPADWQVEGSREYRNHTLPSFLKPGLTVWDIGSGRTPMISPQRKAEIGMTVVGLDIDPEELKAAPPGAYDRSIVADLTKFEGDGSADLVVSHCCLEHVPDNRASMRAIASMLKPGGRAVIYQPSRNAAFSRLNMILPEAIKLKLLGALPDKGGKGGFKAFYNHCTPAQFKRLAREHGLEIEQERVFWNSGYFQIFPPLHVLWRGGQALFRLVAGEQAAESFMLVLRKP
ncbi:2-polyprenyl-6-hydroxyphenyl methylase/3-demethylubiquinone-9 3-methyltransferase [Caulobacter ginsengisoli]|uniref:2-polyprenyl-6-hydroxyphenyl methylase/3-demethylubiquinone-9 3-methyltransferase n=1 Tax=Caulobacter ginsengisoli TaxID=400775 RepID=A0ABU0IQE3_9CAUL|nr:class I SAM-dependent methyltransferase [Caulobacter ginsengisoli]MDQ0464231.1 2-polyprenyl-6-hydroxyphenyl methylase/3-demethylubiquinone-9 3-methyltransferase [Caulobacter ginsengisoli]